jgi:hypothetical protein
MTEAIRIQKDVPTANCVSNSWIRQNRSQLIRPSPHSQLKSRTSKRKTLDRFSGRLTVSALPGAELAIEYLYSKYIKNLSVHSIRQTGGVALSFLKFLHDSGTTILTLTRRDVGSFVEHEQDRGLRPVATASGNCSTHKTDAPHTLPSDVDSAARANHKNHETCADGSSTKH